MKRLFAVFCLQVLLCLAADSNIIRGRRATVVETDTHFQDCTQAPIELGIVLDTSASVTPGDFNKSISFLVAFLSHFDLGSGTEGVRVSIITFAKGIYPEDGFNLTTYDTKEEVLNAVRNIPHRKGLYTDTGKGIRYMHEVQLNPAAVRSYAAKISIVITDGNSQEPVKTRIAAENARADGIKIFTIGVGNVKDEELLNIAGNISTVTKVETYDQLSTIQNTLATKACIHKEKPTEPPLPQTYKEKPIEPPLPHSYKEKPTEPPLPQTFCGEFNPTDVNFVFSPTSLGLEATSCAISFIKDTISAKDLIECFRYGLMTNSGTEDLNFDLDTHSTLEEYMASLETYGWHPLSHLLELLATDGFSEERGGRASARKVAVIITTVDAEDVADLEEYVRQLTSSDVRVYIADPTGNGLDVANAVTLTGETTRLQSDNFVANLCEPINVL